MQANLEESHTARGRAIVHHALEVRLVFGRPNGGRTTAGRLDSVPVDR